jgi:hypothetical protein
MTTASTMDVGVDNGGPLYRFAAMGLRLSATQVLLGEDDEGVASARWC